MAPFLTTAAGLPAHPGTIPVNRHYWRCLWAPYGRQQNEGTLGKGFMMANMAVDGSEIVEEGRTCWRVARAGRASVLIDGAAYFGALRKALLKARHSVFIVGWDIDSRVEILGEDRETDDDAPSTLGELLTHMVRRRPALRVHLLLWDYSVVYAMERQPLPSITLDWATPREIKVCLDDVLPLGACHHQKIVVIDDAVAFCGGLDLTIRRWDTARHEPDDPRRRDPDGKSYDPFHDIQMCVDGEAAGALADLVRKRWHEASCKQAERHGSAEDPWPDDLIPDFEDVDIAVARTLPAYDGRPEVREIEALYLAAIGRAERFVYVENQFLTAKTVADRLARRLEERPELEVLLISPQDHDSWLEARSMKAGRIRFMARLQEAGAEDRVRLVHPAVATDDGAQSVMVHAKLMIVDDVFLRVGSSNLNNRSMGMDTECDLAIEAASEEQKDAIARIRNRLLAEHFGVPESTVAGAWERHGTLFAALDSFDGKKRSLAPIEDEGEYADSLSETVAGLADPEKPVELPDYLGDMFGGKPAKKILGRVGTLVVLGMAVIALALAWRFTPLSELTDPEALRSFMDGFVSSRWAPVFVVGLFIVAGLMVFPVTVLIALTAMVFEPLLALACAGAGSILSAAVTYQLGAVLGRNHLREILGKRLNRISRALARKGVLSVMAIRLVPIAPFTLINLVAGISHIRFRDYLFGSVLGLAPGIVMITFLGNRFAKVLSDPSTGELALLAGLVVLWLGVSATIQFFVSRLKSNGDS